jgi:FkbM family methyltransferase
VTLLSSTARRIADIMGRDSWLIRVLRPLYEQVLAMISGGRGISWSINGVAYRIDPRHRHQMGATYDAQVASWIAARVTPGQSLLDVGANVGIYVLQFAHWSAPDGTVIAVEPNGASRSVLERHVRMNGLETRVQVVPAAVGAAGGEAQFFASETDGMSRLGAPNPVLGDRITSVTVPVITLDELCRSRGLVPDWLLIDVEGFEIAALMGGRKLIAANRERITLVVEMHPDSWEIAGTSRATLESLLRELGLHAEPLSGQSDPLAEYGHVWLRPG